MNPYPQRCATNVVNNSLLSFWLRHAVAQTKPSLYESRRISVGNIVNITLQLVGEGGTVNRQPTLHVPIGNTEQSNMLVDLRNPLQFFPLDILPAIIVPIGQHHKDVTFLVVI